MRREINSSMSELLPLMVYSFLLRGFMVPELFNFRKFLLTLLIVLSFKHLNKCFNYHNNPKYWDRLAQANSVDPVRCI